MDETTIILVEKKVESVRINILIKQIKLHFSKDVIAFKSLSDKSQTLQKSSIIVSELECKEDVEHLFEATKTDLPDDAAMVGTKWLSDCIRAKKLEFPAQQYFLPSKNPKVLQVPMPTQEVQSAAPQPEFLCQMRCPMVHHNSIFTDALSTLGRSAEHSFGVTKDAQFYAKALAFDRAAGYLKSLAHPVTSLAQLSNCRYLGSHALKVIGEILDYGSSAEVDAVLASELYQSMVQLTSVYGVGQSLAYKWHSRGVRTVSQALQRVLQFERVGQRDPDFVGGDYRRLQAGLAFHADLCQRQVTRSEAYLWRDRVTALLSRLRGPGYRVTLVGGFARGKATGHDCDLLLTHETDEGREMGAVAALVRALTDYGLVLHGSYEANSFSQAALSRDFRVKELRSTLDHFEKWLGVVRFPNVADDADAHTFDNASEPPPVKRPRSEDASATAATFAAFNSLEEAVSLANGPDKPNWLARRVDLIAVPWSQYHYAITGWIGNRMFNRDLRLFAQRHRRMKLTSHGLFDLQREISLPASSEEEVFQHLGLEFIPPEFRNC